MSEQHSLLPWYESKTGNHQGLIISEADGANVAVTYAAKDAAFIVRACNAHDDLVAALQCIVNSEELNMDTVVCDFETLQGVARAALAKATQS